MFQSISRRPRSRKQWGARTGSARTYEWADRRRLCILITARRFDRCAPEAGELASEQDAPLLPRQLGAIGGQLDGCKAASRAVIVASRPWGRLACARRRLLRNCLRSCGRASKLRRRRRKRNLHFQRVKCAPTWLRRRRDCKSPWSRPAGRREREKERRGCGPKQRVGGRLFRVAQREREQVAIAPIPADVKFCALKQRAKVDRRHEASAKADWAPTMARP